MEKIFRNFLAIMLGVSVMISCADDPLLESGNLVDKNDAIGEDKLPPNEHWGWVGAYPGEVSNSITRLDDQSVTINGSYELNKFELNSNLGYLQSTGLYVAPAEKITIHYSGAAGNLHYQVGIASWDLLGDEVFKRYSDVSMDGVLIQGENIINSNFGGNLYFYFEGEPGGADVEVTVDGAIKSSDYVLNETDLAEWRALVTDSIAPMIWGELKGEHVIFTLPLSVLNRIERPDVLLAYYDNLIKNEFVGFSGLNIDDLNMPIRVYYDLQLPKNEGGNVSKTYPFYPMGYVSKTADSLDKVLVQVPMLELELKEPANQIILNGLAAVFTGAWNSSPWLGDIMQGMPVEKVVQKGGGLSLSALDGTPIAKEKRVNNVTDVQKETMIWQLLQEYSWDLLEYIGSKSREEIPLDVPELFKNDVLPIYASEYAGVNLIEFFEDWGYPISEIGQRYMRNYPEPAEKFWENVDMAQLPALEGPGAIGTAFTKVIPVLDTLYNRESWVNHTKFSTSTYSDEENVLSPGAATNLFDGKNNTTWHTKWQNGGSKYPHWVEVELVEQPIAFNYAYMVPFWHENNPSPRTFVLEYIQSGEDDWKIYVKDGGSAEEQITGTIFYWPLADKAMTGTIFHLDKTIVADKFRFKFLTVNVNAHFGENNKFTNAVVSDIALGLLK